jgi:CRP/FNR family transcriptional regulator
MQDMFIDGEQHDISRGVTLNCSDYAYYIVDGAVGQYSKTQNGSRLLFAYKTGELFPLQIDSTSLSSGRTYSFKTLSRSQLIKIPIAQFKRLIVQPKYHQAVMEYAINIMRLQMERIDNLQEDEVLRRLLERLIYIALRFGTRQDDTIVIDIPMSHVDLATSINTTRETVNRHMKTLERMGVISLHRQMIRINSLDEIKRISEQEFADKPSASRTKATLLVASAVSGALLELFNGLSTPPLL